MAHDLAFKSAQLIEVEYDALADLSAFGRENSKSAGGNVDGLERIFGATCNHVAAQQFKLRACVPTLFLPRPGGRAQNGYRRF
jgi:hypothetical protein